MTVDEVEQLHIESWRLGLKALAIYRDNCKVGQPLSSTKTDKAIAEAAAKLIETVVVQQHQPPDRERLPRMRNSKTFSFRVADCHGYVTVGEYDDGRPGEIFLRVAKQGSTLAGIMDAFAISVSHGLQYGVPIRAFVDMYTNMRFEPAGMTDDPDIRFASSLVDYIFRRLAVEYLTHQERVDLGILTIDERMQPTLPGVEEHATPNSMGSEIVPDPVAREGGKAAVAIAKAVPVVAAAPAPGVRRARTATSAAWSCNGPGPASSAPAAARPAAAPENHGGARAHVRAARVDRGSAGRSCGGSCGGARPRLARLTLRPRDRGQAPSTRRAVPTVIWRRSSFGVQRNRISGNQCRWLARAW